jgi:uncharacterized CHY-type Zn-finger protein
LENQKEEKEMKKLICSTCREELKITYEDDEKVWVKACSNCQHKSYEEGRTTGSYDPHGTHEMGR